MISVRETERQYLAHTADTLEPDERSSRFAKIRNLMLEQLAVSPVLSLCPIAPLPCGACLLSLLLVSFRHINTLMATATDRLKIAKENSTVPDAGERRVSLLVVEDDENISSAINEYFSRAGYDVTTVEDGLTGVKTALDDPPDAVVLDLMLPKMDGLAASSR